MWFLNVNCCGKCSLLISSMLLLDEKIMKFIFEVQKKVLKTPALQKLQTWNEVQYFHFPK